MEERNKINENHDGEEDEDNEDQVYVRTRAKTKSMIREFMADGNEINVHRTNPTTPQVKPLYSPNISSVLVKY